MTRTELEGHVALVTGGSRGIGRAICLRLAEAGAAVAVNYNQNQNAADEVVSRIEAGGGRALALQADVSEKAAVDAMLNRIREGLGTVDILVNNAGIMRSGRLLDHREEDFDAMWRTNVKGVLYCAAVFAPGMIDLGWGRVINVLRTPDRNGAARHHLLRHHQGRGPRFDQETGVRAGTKRHHGQRSAARIHRDGDDDRASDSGGDRRGNRRFESAVGAGTGGR